MKYQRLAILFWLSVMILPGFAQIAAQSQSDGNLKKYYEACIAEKIAKCQSKTEMEKSRLKNLRLDAAIAAEKARFLSVNMDVLIEEMTERNVGKKSYKIDAFLNEKFFDDYRRLSKNN